MSYACQSLVSATLRHPRPPRVPRLYMHSSGFFHSLTLYFTLHILCAALLPLLFAHFMLTL